jgi:TusA-related sulfurtransferase
MSEIIVDRIVDCIGLFCPEPVLRTRNAIETVDIGKVIKVLADDPSSEEDIKAWAKHTGHEILKIEKKDGEFHFYIKRVK